MENLFFERFCLLCKENNETPNAAARAIGKSSGSVTAWKKGTLPRYETLKELAKRFHVSVDYLAGNVNDPAFHLDNDRILREINSYENENAPTEAGERTISDAELKFALWGDATEIDDDDLEDVRRYAAFVKERKKAKK